MKAKAITSTFPSDLHHSLFAVLSEANRWILDKEDVTEKTLATLLAGGHLLIEDHPGMGKTLLVKVFSTLLGLDFQRIQFTNDLLPADITGTSVFNTQSQNFEFIEGPLFGQLILADEINRGTPKTQSACLQAMEEYKITVDRKTYTLKTPFFVFATQNPRDSAGTFPLPDSQLDRFLMCLQLGPPSRNAEKEILLGKNRHHDLSELSPLLDSETLIQAMDAVAKIHVSEAAIDYLQDLIEKSRQLSVGLSPRGGRDFLAGAKALAFLKQRDFVIPEDFQTLGVDVMGHRLSHKGARTTTGRDLAREILQSVPTS